MSLKTSIEALATRIAQEVRLKANLASPAFSGSPTAPTPGVDDNSTKIATTAFVQNMVAGLGSNVVSDYQLAEDMTIGAPAILRSDAKIENVHGSQTTEDLPLTAEAVVFDSSGTFALHSDISFDPMNGNRFIVCYRPASSPLDGKMLVGTISNGVISYGSICTFNTGTTGCPKVVFDPHNNNKFIIVFQDGANGGYGTAIVGTLNSNVPSFGSEYVFSSVNTPFVSFDFDPFNANKILVSYSNGSYTGYAVIGTISGDSISFGTAINYSASATYLHVFFDDVNADRALIVHGSSIKANVILISGTSLSSGIEYVLASNNSGRTSASKIPGESLKFFATTSATGTSGSATQCYAEVDASDVISAKVSVSNTYQNMAIAAGPADQIGGHAFAAIYTYSTSAARCLPSKLTLPRTSFPSGSYSAIATANKTGCIEFDHKGSKGFVVILENGSSFYGLLTTITSNAKETSLLGILQESGSAGNTKPVLLMGGIDEKQSGLTPAQDYYINPSGGITTAKSDDSVLLGRSITGTSIAIRPFYY